MTADLAATIVRQLEEAAFEDCMAKGRFDLLDNIRERGYTLTDDADGYMRFWVADELVLVVSVGVDGALQRLN